MHFGVPSARQHSTELQHRFADESPVTPLLPPSALPRRIHVAARGASGSGGEHGGGGSRLHPGGRRAGHRREPRGAGQC